MVEVNGKSDWFTRLMVVFFSTIFLVYLVYDVLGEMAEPPPKPEPKALPAFYRLPDEIQAAKEAYAEAHGIPKDATLTEDQLVEIITPFYAEHPRNEEGNFVSEDPREFIRVPRQVSKRPSLNVYLPYSKENKKEEYGHETLQAGIHRYRGSYSGRHRVVNTCKCDGAVP